MIRRRTLAVLIAVSLITVTVLAILTHRNDPRQGRAGQPPMITAR
jgi:hypothetical protein